MLYKPIPKYPHKVRTQCLPVGSKQMWICIQRSPTKRPHICILFWEGKVGGGGGGEKIKIMTSKKNL